MASAMSFTLSVPGQKPMTVALSRFAQNIADWSPFWNDYFLPAWYRHVAVHYQTRGRSTGEEWPALSARYAEWKQKHWPGLPPGVLSGALRESLEFRNDANAIVHADKTRLALGSRVRHAMYQQKGTKRMPARPPLRVNEEFILLIGKLLQQYGHAVSKEVAG